MNIRNQLLCAHSTLLFCLLVGVGGFVVSGFLPPPSPGLNADQLSAFITNDFSLRIGVSLMALGAPIFMGLAVAVTNQMRRIEGSQAVLSNLQMLAAAVGVLAIQFPAYFWLAISYRPDTPRELIVLFNDLSFFLLLAAYSPAVLQNLCIGLCILGAPKQTVYPRWLGYANLWLALTLLPGILTPFFRSGPFTYSGLFGFWIVAIGFFIWVLLMWWYTVKAIRQQATAGEPSH